MDHAVTAFTLHVEEAALDDLRARLDRTRWPEAETVGDWSQGAPLAEVRALCAYWRNFYDWRRCEARLNSFGQFKTEIDGLGIHFLHIRSVHPGALPLLLTHGWPGSVIEFLSVIGPLTDPAAHGGHAADAFDVIIPSLPGFGFSEKPARTGWTIARIAKAWTVLMSRLGYHRWVAQGGDWGAGITSQIGADKPPGCMAIHVNIPWIAPEPGDMNDTAPSAQAALAARATYRDVESGYARQQATRPQTLGYGLADSPAGQAAWIYEKLYGWTDSERRLSMDDMLDNIMLYWLPGTAASSARLYWESLAGFASIGVEIPVGVSLYPKEHARVPRHWAERHLKNIVHWRELDRGGHFPAWEQPTLFVSEIRECFRGFR